jgi:nitric oxide reductase NorD protein
MPSARAWIDSRHLRETAEGADAIETLEALDPALRDRLLTRGDVIAAWSTSLAHSFLPVAARAAAIGAPAYEEWERAFLAVAGESNVPRELAIAFFRLEPHDLCAWSAALRREWIASVTTLAETSRRLATALVEATATLLAHGGRLDEASLSAWHDSARQLLARGGWRSEFLAEAFVGGGSRLLGRLDARAVAEWADIVAILGTTGRNPRPPQPTARLLALDDRALAGVLHLCASAAAREPRAAQRLLDLAPHAVATLDPPHAAALLEACARSTSLDALADSMTLLAGVLHGVPASSVAFLLGEAHRIADAAPAVLPAFLRTMDRALEEGGASGVELWVTRGLELAENGADAAAVAHFRLETRTSHKLLVQKSAAVAFEEVDGMLRRYLTMMSRRSFQLVPSPGMWMRPPLVAPEDVAIRLPERVDLFDSSDDNQALYKIVATHIAGRFEYGTYDFQLDTLVARGWSPPSMPASEDGARDIIAFLACFPNPLLASALFVLLEGVRIDASLERDFPGLRRELARMGRMYASTVVPGGTDRYDERLLDALFQMGLARRSVDELDARLRAQGEFVAASIELLRTKEATVYDAAALTVAYYGGLAYAEARALEEGEDSPFAVEMGGATVVDPFEHLDGSDREENTAPWRPDPARAIQENESGEVDVKLELSDDDGTPQGGGRPVSLEELKSLLERGGDLRITEMQGKIEEGLGLYITDLLGKIPAEQMKELRDRIASGDAPAIRAWLARQAAGTSFWYDEWDHRIHDYRRRWCRVTEVPGEEDAGEYFADALARSGELVSRIKRDFQLLRPDQLRRVPRAEQGEEFDLNALVEAHSDRRGRRTPSDRLYVTRKPEERDVATLFLIDMSASTDEPLPGTSGDRRVIDLTKDTLAVLSQVLGEIGDSYAIYGFSGHGRENVELYHVKSFAERLSDKVKARLGGIGPKRSTRMGAALRHAGEKLARTTARSRHLILLSDGFPQDFDYGDDRRSNAYGIRDTLQALRELEKRGMQTFCITVDPAGHDYLGEMCPSSRYAVIDNIDDLPSELVRIYRKITRS